MLISTEKWKPFWRHCQQITGANADYFSPVANRPIAIAEGKCSAPSNQLTGTPHFSVFSAPSVVNIVVMDERDFFDEKESKKAHTLTCPHCRQPGEYELAWLVRTKKKQLSGRADERDRAKFAKAQSYMVRRDDMVMCKNIRCRKRFEVAGVQSVAFLN
jgi:hypothetical protein